MDARGNVTREILGNNVTTVRNYDQQTGRLASINATRYFGTAGDVQDLSYQWDALGNLSSCTEQPGNKNLSESFSYDGLNRLKISQVAGQSGKVVSYDLLGNITYKSDIGSYSYGTGVEGRGTGPHAVTRAGETHYVYDANGNNINSHYRDIELDGLSRDWRNIDYTTFDKVKSISKNGHTTTFSYGADRKRYKRTDSNGNGTRTTLYIGGVKKPLKPMAPNK